MPTPYERHYLKWIIIHFKLNYCKPPKTKLPFFEQSMGQKVWTSNIPSDDAKMSLHCPNSIYAV